MQHGLERFTSHPGHNGPRHQSCRAHGYPRVSQARHHGGAFRRGSDEVGRMYLNELSDEATSASVYETLSGGLRT
jgi:hypothetical protein